MCIDQTRWRFCQYRKHETPPAFRDKPCDYIDGLTLNSDSLYYPQFQPREIERRVVDVGLYVQSPKAHKTFKILEFEVPIGACNGQPSKWVKIEATSDQYHGRPIAYEQYTRLLSRQIPCCR